MIRDLSADVVLADYVDVLDRVDVPTLILTPSHDVLIGQGAAAIMHEGIPDAREVVLERTGHMFRFSHPATYAAAVHGFLAQTVERSEPGVSAAR